MKTYNNKYRGFNIHIEEIRKDCVEFRVEKLDNTIVEDTDGFCVTVEQAMDECKDIIDDILNTER